METTLGRRRVIHLATGRCQSSLRSLSGDGAPSVREEWLGLGPVRTDPVETNAPLLDAGLRIVG
jgi:hypothetical protein